LIWYDTDIPGTPLPDISSYEIIPRIVTTDPKVVIDIYRDDPSLGAFHFAGSQISKETALVSSKSLINGDFHYTFGTTQIHSLQGEDANPPKLFGTEPYFEVPKTGVTVHQDGTVLSFSHSFVHNLLSKLMTSNLDGLFDYYLKVPDKNDAYGGVSNTNGNAPYHELKQSYSLYNWEAAFHAPMQLVDSLLKSQQFEQALKMCHYVFNPYEQGSENNRFWKFLPFKEVDAKNILEKLFMGLQPRQPNDAINEWRDNPFQPHVVARSRPSAYMKWVVMKYIEILIAWGDHLFRQDTIETLNQATQLYVLAAHIYGPRGQKIPKRGKIQPQTYNSLLDKWDAFGNAMVELELAFPFSNQTLK
jgi:hypothetical protein